MANINHEIKIKAPVEDVTKAINTLDGLKAWYSSHIEGSTKLNDSLVVKSEGKPSFTWKIVESDPKKKIVWECTQGPGDSVGTQAIFKISKDHDGRALLEFSHTEWPGEHGNFRKCNTLWAILLHHLKEHVETGKVEPVIG